MFSDSTERKTKLERLGKVSKITELEGPCHNFNLPLSPVEELEHFKKAERTPLGLPKGAECPAALGSQRSYLTESLYG